MPTTRWFRVADGMGQTPRSRERSLPPSVAEEGGDCDPQPEIRIDLIAEDGAWGEIGSLPALVEAAAAAVARWPAIAARMPALACEVAVVLSSDRQVAALNGQFRGKAKPTNVLSFPAARGPMPALSGGSEPTALGDIVLAAETIFAEARELGIAPGHHLQHLVVHGLLHLLGYDHIEAEEALVMEALETQILAGLGVGDPYAGSDLIEAETAD